MKYLVLWLIVFGLAALFWDMFSAVIKQKFSILLFVFSVVLLFMFGREYMSSGQWAELDVRQAEQTLINAEVRKAMAK